MKLLKKMFLQALLASVSVFLTFTPLTLYHAFIFKEKIIGESNEIIEGIYWIIYIFILILLILSIIISLIQFFIKKDLSKKALLFIFIGTTTVLSFPLFLEDIRIATFQLMTFILYSLYCLLSQYWK